MKILKSLSKKILIFIILFLFSSKAFSENKPVDIWNIDKEDLTKENQKQNKRSEKEKKSPRCRS